MIVNIVKLAREKRECLKALLEFSLDSFALIEGLEPFGRHFSLDSL
jgi:hypothetical protein